MTHVCIINKQKSTLANIHQETRRSSSSFLLLHSLLFSLFRVNVGQYCVLIFPLVVVEKAARMCLIGPCCSSNAVFSSSVILRSIHILFICEIVCKHFGSAPQDKRKEDWWEMAQFLMIMWYTMRSRSRKRCF